MEHLAKSHTRKEISEITGIKYRTVCDYLHKKNIEPKKTKHIFGRGRPWGTYDKKPRCKKKENKIYGGNIYEQSRVQELISKSQDIIHQDD